MLEFSSLLHGTHFTLRCNLDQWTSSWGPQAPCLKCGSRVCVLVLVPLATSPNYFNIIFIFFGRKRAKEKKRFRTGKAEFKSRNIYGSYSTAQATFDAGWKRLMEKILTKGISWLETLVSILYEARSRYGVCNFYGLRARVGWGKEWTWEITV
jgi:hypothetical protein